MFVLFCYCSLVALCAAADTLEPAEFLTSKTNVVFAAAAVIIIIIVV